MVLGHLLATHAFDAANGTRRPTMVVFEPSFHGTKVGCLSFYVSLSQKISNCSAPSRQMAPSRALFQSPESLTE
jgi:hypothetical protein